MTENTTATDTAAEATETPAAEAPAGPLAETSENEDILEALRDVVDPELGINVVDLGLVYGITLDAERNAAIDMTLTSAACPLTDVIEDQGRKLEADAMRDGNNSTGPRVGPPFGPLELHQVRWVHETSVPEVIDMIASRSYVILLPPDQRERLLADVRHLLETDPALAGQASIPLPYVTWCWRTVRP